MEDKCKYRIKNWPQYNKSLVNRGSITFWFDEESIQKRYCKTHTQETGRPRIYSDEAILCALTSKILFRQPYRALVGFLISVMSLLGVNLDIPHYSVICRRAKELGQSVPKLSNNLPTDIVFDSTGLKVDGEGEWKVKMHGASKRRTWRKLHVGIDPDSQEILVSELTLNSEGDSTAAKRLMKKTPKPIQRTYGDGAYDDFEFRRAAHARGSQVIVPPPKNAIVHGNEEDEALLERDAAVLEIAGLGGDGQARSWWKRMHGYHRCSLVENSIYRIKQLTGDKLSSPLLDQQKTESYLKCLIVNKMTGIRMPKGVWEVVC